MDITVQELKKRIDEGEEILMIDVREQHERDEFNIGGEFIPLNSIPTSLEDLAKYKDQEVVLYCRSGNRSGIAAQFMAQNGFQNPRNLLGGMLAWIDEFGA